MSIDQLLWDIHYSIPGSPNVGGVASQLVHMGWNEAHVTSMAQLIAMNPTGDIIFGLNTPEDAHIGVITQVANGVVYDADNSSATGTFTMGTLQQRVSFMPGPGTRFGTNNLYILVPPQN